MRPAPNLLRLLFAWTLLGVAAAVWPPLLPLWAGAGLALAVAAAVAWRRLRRIPPPPVERDAPSSLPLGAYTPIRLRLSNPGREELDVEIFDTPPLHSETEGLPSRQRVPGRGWVELEYRLRPTRRGDHRFGPADLLLRQRGDLWRRRLSSGAPQDVRVVPNFQAVARYAILALADQLGQIGIRVSRRRGEGLEFQELREYRDGDSLRRIDWKATARRQRLIARQYQEERNQQIVCLIDCGRRMHAKDGDLTHFDHVLNTVLLLSYVALRQGDSVGFLTFSGPERWLPPVQGNVGLEAIQRLVYDLETTQSPSDYLEAATRLMMRQKRRALVLLLSNLRDEDSDEIVPALRLLRSRHLVLLASLRETVLKQSLERPIGTLRDALRTAAIHRYLSAREGVLEKLQVGGILTLDTEPEMLPYQVVNRYLEVKGSGLL
ncbi:MAG TPA: DUF58 domain-containing protein [Thermoanaerobaculia bacterium]|nr:DUF58 domain-containing protein [Thermoanaerobaculia bacterium]